MRISTTGSASAPRAGAIASCCRTSAVTSAIQGGESQYHGGLGEFEVSDFAPATRFRGMGGGRRGVRASAQSRLQRRDHAAVSASYQLGIGRHWRTSSASAFLRPVAHRPNLTVITGAQVSKVIVQRAASRPAWNGSETAGAHACGSRPRGRVVGRRAAVAATVAAVGHRPGGSAARVRHSRRRRRAGGRPQSAGSLSGAHDRSAEAADLAQRPGSQSAAGWPRWVCNGWSRAAAR